MCVKVKTAISLILAFGLIFVGNVAYAKFFAGMSTIQVSQEITVQLMRGSDLATIASAAHDSGIKSEQVTAVLIRSGQAPRAVVSTMIKIDPSAAAMITAAALACKPGKAAEIMDTALAMAPQLRDAIVAKALTVPMINPADILGATASGGESRVNHR